jgi:hypothetical protein
MAQLLVYNPSVKSAEGFELCDSDMMPYSGGSLTLNDFKGSSCSSILWTDKRVMTAWKLLKSAWQEPIFIGSGFKRIWEGGHGYQSHHYTGTAFDIGQDLSNTELLELRDTAEAMGKWTYIENASLTIGFIHIDLRFTNGHTGYPAIKKGDEGVYVFVLQDALNTLGYTDGVLDGLFGKATEKSLVSYQKDNGLEADGVAAIETWIQLTSQACGIGRTPTVIN